VDTNENPAAGGGRAENFVSKAERDSSTQFATPTQAPTDQRFGSWQVLRLDSTRKRVTCRCDCGEVRQVGIEALLIGSSLGCGDCRKITPRPSNSRGCAMSPRLWFYKRNPTEVLGSIIGMLPDAGFVYLIALDRIYENDGPIPDTEWILARRTGLTPMRVRTAIAWLETEGKVTRLPDGNLDIEATRYPLAERAKRRTETLIATKKAADARWQKDEQYQQKDDAQRNASRIPSKSQSQSHESSLRSDSKSSLRSDSSSGTDDPKKAERKTRASERAETDNQLLDRITDQWNAWARAHGSRPIKVLTEKRGIHCRRRIAELMEIEGSPTPEAAFAKALTYANESFFVKGSPRKPLGFDQLMREGFLANLIEGEFVYRPPKPNGAFR
jgi:hypothetical protein